MIYSPDMRGKKKAFESISTFSMGVYRAVKFCMMRDHDGYANGKVYERSGMSWEGNRNAHEAAV